MNLLKFECLINSLSSTRAVKVINEPVREVITQLLEFEAFWKTGDKITYYHNRMDKSWMNKRRFSVEYVEGVKSFMHFVEGRLGVGVDIHCPCNHCLNVLQNSQDVVLEHLMINGINVGYTTWIYHGETSTTDMDDIDINVDTLVDEDDEDNLYDLLDEHHNFMNNESCNDDSTNKGYEDFMEMLGKAHKDLYHGCTNPMAPGVSKKKNKSNFADYLSQGHGASLITRSPIEGLGTSSIHHDMASGTYQGKQKDFPSMFNVKGASLSRTKTLYQAWKDTVDEMENPSAPNPSTPSTHTPHMTTTTVHTQSQSAIEDELEEQIDPDNLEERLGPGFEDDLEENMDFSSKAVRGLTRGLRLHKQFKRTGKKMEVFIDPNDGRALETHQSAAVANEIGQIAATYVWPIHKKKADKKAIFNVVMLKLQVKLNIKNLNDICVREKVWNHFLKIVRGRRAEYHKNFKDNGEKEKPSAISDETWKKLCEHWKKDEVQKNCEKNRVNRSLLKKPHNKGPNCFVALFRESKEKEGEGFNEIEFFKQCRTKKDGNWMTTECEDAYLKMKEMFAETAESEEPMTAKEVMDEVLGHKSGYCEGIGYGPSIPSTKRSHMESENAHLKKLTNRMSKENSELSQQVKELKEAQVVFQKFMHDQLRKESESREDSCAAAAAAIEGQQQLHFMLNG
ncbi:hypothetical protein LINPERHAP1_LOCUS8017 [Linum perenne]